ncbi:MAG: hypothetical protein ACRD29_07655 [Acidimicrobiales bacterium]
MAIGTFVIVASGLVPLAGCSPDPVEVEHLGALAELGGEEVSGDDLVAVFETVAQEEQLTAEDARAIGELVMANSFVTSALIEGTWGNSYPPASDADKALRLAALADPTARDDIWRAMTVEAAYRVGALEIEPDVSGILSAPMRDAIRLALATGYALSDAYERDDLPSIGDMSAFRFLTNLLVFEAAAILDELGAEPGPRGDVASGGEAVESAGLDIRLPTQRFDGFGSTALDYAAAAAIYRRAEILVDHPRTPDPFRVTAQQLVDDVRQMEDESGVTIVRDERLIFSDEAESAFFGELASEFPGPAGPMSRAIRAALSLNDFVDAMRRLEEEG